MPKTRSQSLLQPPTPPPPSGTFPQIFPPEIRSQIFRYVLESPTEMVQLEQSDINPSEYQIYTTEGPGEPIKLSFLRTCRLIYEECRDMLWKYNTLDMDRLYEINMKGQLEMLLPDSLVLNVRDVQLQCWLLERDMVFVDDYTREMAIERKLRDLELWAHKGALKSVTLDITNWRSNDSGIISHDEFQDPLKNWNWNPDPRYPRGIPQEYVGIFAKATEPHKFLSRVERTIAFEMGDMDWGDDPVGPTRTFDAKLGNPNDMLQAIAVIWGGDLVFNDELRYEDGHCLSKTFVKPEPKNGEDAVWYYGADLSWWYGTTYYYRNLLGELGLTEEQFDLMCVMREMMKNQGLLDTAMKIWAEKVPKVAGNGPSLWDSRKLQEGA